MAIVRGVAMAPDMGAARCHAVEVAFETGDYELAVMGRVVKEECSQKPVAVLQGSGVCEFHNRQIQERRRVHQQYPYSRAHGDRQPGRFSARYRASRWLVNAVGYAPAA
jgi:hypothetical protein